MTLHHHLDAAEFDSLAAGLGDGTVVQRLHNAQMSKRMVQLRILLDLVSSRQFGEHFALLRDAVRRMPKVGPFVLSLPHTGAWLASTLRRLRSGSRPEGASERSIEVDLSYLGALAATAGIRAGLEFSIDLPVRGGWLFLPALGRTRVGDTSCAVVSYAGDEVRVGSVVVPAGPGATSELWTPVRHLRAEADGLAIVVCLDDLDPFRDCHGLNAAERLDPHAVRSWQDLLNDAWELLARHHRPYAEGIAEGLTTVVPLQASGTGVGVNVTSMDAFGAVAMTHPVNGQALALGLVHEFQHAKLGAVSDIVPLLHRSNTHYRYYAPWRDDARPIGAVLHGVYAFMGVAEFWRRQRPLLNGGNGRLAEMEFARWSDRVTRTSPVLDESGQLTSAGRRFLHGMRRAQSSWRDELVPAEAARLARDAAEDHWVGWQLRNRQPEAEWVDRLARLWRSGQPCLPVVVPTATGSTTERWLSHSVRLDLAQLRLTDPDRFDRLCAGSEGLEASAERVTEGDLALARGDYPAALAAYREQILCDARSLPAWIGLALACQRGYVHEAPTPLRCPELCRAVYLELHVHDADVDPLALARWLAPATTVDRAERGESTWAVAPDRS